GGDVMNVHPCCPDAGQNGSFLGETEPTGSDLMCKKPLVGHAGCEDEEAQQEKKRDFSCCAGSKKLT
ncbi:hypothetical protein, partial [Akkermansia sp.]|uniref:hypothetical protein n=1 Tax=Akkermansia sp. TaxID=1872421 RepID=UPI003AF55AE7